jgi:hypothetical protein
VKIAVGQEINMRGVMKTVMAVASFFLAGCISQPVVKVVDLSAGHLESGALVTVDGRPDEAAWSRAVVIPFEETGKVQLLWDDRRLYGFITKYEHQRFGFDFDEQICVAVDAGKRTAKLFLEEAPGRNALALREAWVGSWPTAETGRIALSSNSIAVASMPNDSAQGFAWSAEFSLDWQCLSCPSPETVGTEVYVYRLVPRRPITHAARMSATGNKRDGQPEPAR